LTQFPFGYLTKFCSLGPWIVSRVNVFSRYFLTSFLRIKSCIIYQKFSLVSFGLKKMLADILVTWTEKLWHFLSILTCKVLAIKQVIIIWMSHFVQLWKFYLSVYYVGKSIDSLKRNIDMIIHNYFVEDVREWSKVDLG